MWTRIAHHTAGKFPYAPSNLPEQEGGRGDLRYLVSRYSGSIFNGGRVGIIGAITEVHTYDMYRRVYRSYAIESGTQGPLSMHLPGRHVPYVARLDRYPTSYYSSIDPSLHPGLPGLHPECPTGCPSPMLQKTARDEDPRDTHLHLIGTIGPLQRGPTTILHQGSERVQQDRPLSIPFWRFAAVLSRFLGCPVRTRIT